MTEETTVDVAVEKTDTVVENVEVAPEVDTVVETPAVEVAKSDEVVVAEETPVANEAVEVVAEAEVTEVSKSDEAVDSIAEIKNTLESAFSDLVLTVKSLQAEVEMLKSTKVDVEAAKTSFEAVAKDIAAVSSEFNEFGKRVELVEQDTAFRKSGDLGEIVQNQPETVEKSLWGGSFLKTADLFN